MARLAVYGAISVALAGGVIASAFAQRSNFYAACVYLFQSNACMMVSNCLYLGSGMHKQEQLIVDMESKE